MALTNLLSKARWRSGLLALGLLAASIGGAAAQSVTNYTFGTSSGTYSPITGTIIAEQPIGSTAGFDDNNFGGNSSTFGYPIGFDFMFNGRVFDAFQVQNNGFIRLITGSGTSNVSSDYTSLDGSGTGFDNIIAPFNRDLQTQAGAALSYTTTGSVGSRVLTIQFKNYRRFSQTGDTINFQAKLTEGTNTVRFVYGRSLTSAAITDVTVGLRGVGSSEVRALSGTFATATAGTTYTAGTTDLDGNGTAPALVVANGTTFTFTPGAAATTCTTPLTFSTTYGPFNQVTVGFARSANATGSVVRYKVGAGAYTYQTVTGNTASFASAPSTTYTVEVRSTCSGTTSPGDTSAYVVSTVTTPAAAASCAAPGTPTISNILSNSVTVSFSPSLSATNGYTIRFKTSAALTYTNFVSTVSNSNNVITGLLANTTYNFQVVSKCSATDSSAVSGTATATTTATCPAPGSPTFTNTTANSTTVAFTATAAAANGYVIRFKTSAALTYTNFKPTASNTGNVITGLLANTTYNFQIVAKCTPTDSSVVSGTGTVTTTATCAVPTGVTVTNNSSSSQTLSFTSAFGASGNYRVLRSLVSGGPFTAVRTITGASSGAVSTTFTGLTASTQYFYQVRSICTSSDSSTLTSAVNATTPGLPLAFDATYVPSRTYNSVFVGSSAFSFNSTSNDDNFSISATNIGFSFSYLGTAYTQFQVSTNGYITLGSGQSPSTFSNNLSLGSPNKIIAPLFEDLVTPGNTGGATALASSIFYKSNTDSLVVEWKNMETFNNAGPDLNFQVVLYSNGTFRFNYGSIQGFTGQATYEFSYSQGVNGAATSNNPYVAVAVENTDSLAFNVGAPTSNAGLNALRELPACNSSLFWQFGTQNVGAAGNQVPANNECSTAVAVTLGTVPTSNFCNPGTNRNATASTGIPVCGVAGTTPDDDVFYSFAVTLPSSVTLTVRSAGQHNGVLQLLSGACGALVSDTCVNAQGNGQTETLTRNLAVGTYFVRVYNSGTGSGSPTSSGEFYFDAFATPLPPSNDNVAGATVLTTGTSVCSGTSYTTAGATASPQPVCGGIADDDVWFRFVANNLMDTVRVQSGAGFNAHVQVLDSNLVSIACQNNTGLTGLESVALSGLTPGKTYFVRVYNTGVGSSTGNFTICVYGVAQPAIDGQAVKLLLNSTVGTTICPDAVNGASVIIKNNGSQTLNFATNNATINITDGNDTLGTYTLSSGSLNSLETDTFSLGNLDLTSLSGATVSFDVLLDVVGDAVASNDNQTFGTNFTIIGSTDTSIYVENFEDGSAQLFSGSNFFTSATNGTSGSTSYRRQLSSSQTVANFRTPTLRNLGSNTDLTFDYRLTNTSGGAATIGSDNLYVRATTDCGASFDTIYTINSSTFNGTANYNSVSVDLAAYAGQDVGFSFVGNYGSNTYNIDFDNIVVSAPLPTDVGVTAIQLGTGNGCSASATSTVTITVNNYGGTLPTGTNIPVRYRVGGGTIVNETIVLANALSVGGTVNYTFTTTANLSSPGSRTVAARTQLAGDANFPNNRDTIVVTNVGSISSFPYYNDFEGGTNGWSFGNSSTTVASTWAHGTPNKPLVVGARSGSGAISTGGLTQTSVYNNSENSYVQSPCFNFSSATAGVQPWISFFLRGEAEASWDGMQMQVSVNGGAYTQVGSSTDVEWYNDNSLSTAAGFTEGFGITLNGWTLRQHKLPATVIGASAVRIRFVFSSDGSVTRQGIALDDISISLLPQLAATKLRSQDCGYFDFTKMGARSFVIADKVTNATQYEFTFDAPTNGDDYFARTNVPRIDLDSLTYGVTYTVGVRASRQGIRDSIGTTCQIALVPNPTPANIPVTQLRVQDCDMYDFNTSSNRNYIGADIVDAADTYDFEVTNQTTNVVTTFTNASRFALLTSLGITTQDTFSVRVRATIDGVSGVYATSCEVALTKIANLMSTGLRANDCGDTIAAGRKIGVADTNSFAAVFTYNFFNVGTSTLVASVQSSRFVKPDTISALSIPNSYDVTVDYTVNGVVYTGTDVCTITLDSAANRLGAGVASIEAYPNPTNDAWTVSLPSAASVVLTDAAGRVMSSAKLAAGQHRLGQGLAAGTYTLSVVSVEGKTTLRLVMSR